VRGEVGVAQLHVALASGSDVDGAATTVRR
jgi:hypothetical protein